MNSTTFIAAYSVISVIEGMVIIIMWHWVPWVLPFTVQTPMNWMVGNSGGILAHVSNMISNPVCNFGRMASYLICTSLLVRLILIAIKRNAIMSSVKARRSIRITSWVIVGLVLFVATIMNLHALILILPALIFEITLDALISRDAKSTSIASVSTISASVLFGFAIAFSLGPILAKTMERRSIKKYESRDVPTLEKMQLVR